MLWYTDGNEMIWGMIEKIIYNCYYCISAGLWLILFSLPKNTVSVFVYQIRGKNAISRGDSYARNVKFSIITMGKLSQILSEEID